MLAAKDRYQQEVVPEMKKRLGIETVMELHRMQKIIGGIGLGEAIENAKALD